MHRRGQSGHTRIGTFVCRANPTAHPKQAKEPTFPPATNDKFNNRRLNDFKSEFYEKSTASWTIETRGFNKNVFEVSFLSVEKF